MPTAALEICLNQLATMVLMIPASKNVEKEASSSQAVKLGEDFYKIT
jgi:hypothetical protein